MGEIGGVNIPVPLSCRTVTMGDVVKAFRVKDGQDAGGATPPVEEKLKLSLSMVPVESRRRCSLARHRNEGRAEREAEILKDALHAMEENEWWSLEFELIDGWCDFLKPYLDVVQGQVS